jgi:hypothetical protein
MIFDFDFDEFSYLPKVTKFEVREYKHKIRYTTFKWGYLILVFKRTI